MVDKQRQTLDFKGIAPLWYEFYRLTKITRDFDQIEGIKYGI